MSAIRLGALLVLRGKRISGVEGSSPLPTQLSSLSLGETFCLSFVSAAASAESPLGLEFFGFRLGLAPFEASFLILSLFFSFFIPTFCREFHAYRRFSLTFQDPTVSPLGIGRKPRHFKCCSRVAAASLLASCPMRRLVLGGISAAAAAVVLIALALLLVLVAFFFDTAAEAARRSLLPPPPLLDLPREAEAFEPQRAGLLLGTFLGFSSTSLFAPALSMSAKTFSRTLMQRLGMGRDMGGRHEVGYRPYRLLPSLFKIFCVKVFYQRPWEGAPHYLLILVSHFVS